MHLTERFLAMIRNIKKIDEGKEFSVLKVSLTSACRDHGLCWILIDGEDKVKEVYFRTNRG